MEGTPLCQRREADQINNGDDGASSTKLFNILDEKPVEFISVHRIAEAARILPEDWRQAISGLVSCDGRA